jgi:hypothetical protein
MSQARSLPTIRRVLALRRREMRRLHAELGQNGRYLGELDARREKLEKERSAFFTCSGGSLALDLLRLGDAEREWRKWQRQRYEAEQTRGSIESSLVRMRAEIRALELHAERLAADTL